jgi:hypothetical protein
MTAPLVLYIPGLLPKPEPGVHKVALRRCLVEGLRRLDPTIANEFANAERSFDVVAWTYDFYREHRDFSLDAKSIDALIEQLESREEDISEASSRGKRLLRWAYRVGDMFPFLIPHLASERVELHLRDLRRYVRNGNAIGDHTREMLKMPLRAATEAGRPILLIAHSMGSVIAYDTLWEMSHGSRDNVNISRLVTTGSPLGQDYLQRRIFGHGNSDVARYPTNISRWINLAAVGDMTAIDPVLKNDFGEMIELGLVDDIEDIEVFNHFRLNGELNVHAEYGYLINEVTAGIVAEWWRAAQLSFRRNRGLA